MKNKFHIYLFFFGFMCLISLIVSCSKEDIPENPYDQVDYSNHSNPASEPDANSIAGLHKNILYPKCANPGCHDGTFEPDFRTIESSYATLVYQPVNKFTLDSAKIYSLRVIPNNVSDSWLVERLITLTTEYMPSNAQRLSTAEIDHVKNWINGGCKDMNGNIAVKPNLPANILGAVTVDSVYSRIDTVRLGGIPTNPFVVNQGVTMIIAIIANDTADGSNATDPMNFTVKKIKFSTDKNDFSSAFTINAGTYISGFNVWPVTVPVTFWPVGTIVYFRMYVNDGHHSSDTEYPRDESLDYFKTIYAFYVQ